MGTPGFVPGVVSRSSAAIIRSVTRSWIGSLTAVVLSWHAAGMGLALLVLALAAVGQGGGEARQQPVQAGVEQTLLVGGGEPGV